MLLPSLSNSPSTKRREADLGEGSVFSVEPGLFWRWDWGLIRDLSGRGRKEPYRKGDCQGGNWHRDTLGLCGEEQWLEKMLDFLSRR